MCIIRRLSLAVCIASTTLAALALQPAVALAHNPAPVAPSAYTVRAGDSISGIARKFGVRLSDLLTANDIRITSTIHPGDVLVVPVSSMPVASSVPSSSSGNPSTPYTVKAGDSLFAIATRAGVTLRALLAANSFTQATTILPGQVIRLPAAAPTTPGGSSTAITAPAPAITPSDVLVGYLRQQIGKPYKFFTAGPDSFDCSGLVVAGYRQIGVTVPHQSRMQATIGASVDWRNEPIVAGDLIFMVSSVDTTQIGHVGIALDSKTWIQAVAPGIPVRVRPIPTVDKISAVRRILDP
jgi:peptidoglycan endopeptidase LytE